MKIKIDLLSVNGISIILFLLSCNDQSNVIRGKNYSDEYKIILNQNIELVKKSDCGMYKKITLLDKDQIPIKRSWYQKHKEPFFELQIINGEYYIGNFYENRLDTSYLEIPEIKVIHIDSNRYAIEMISNFYPIGFIDYGYNFESLDVFDNDLIDKRYVIFDKSKVISKDHVILKFAFKTTEGKYLKTFENIRISIPN